MVASSLNDLSGTSGYVEVSWSGISLDPNHYGFRIYHRQVGAPSWTLLTEIIPATGTGSYDAYQYANTVQQEITVVEVTIDVDGYLSEGTYDDENTFTPSGDNAYWLVHPTNQSLTMRIPLVQSDSFSEENEHEVLQLLGRGRKVNLGERFGVTGSLSARLTDGASSARAQRLALQNLADSGTELFLRNPFGDLWKVWIGDVTYSLVAGTGSTEVYDIDFSYTEVS